jgi:class 3 adenylate cyclase/tetratricopeptide (TPR) repeat protein
MGELKAALEDALSGRGRLVMVVGEPGIGKTRTAQELATYAGLRRCQVLWGRCYEGQGAPPYWPWVQAIRAYVREQDEPQLRSEMGAGAADIAEIVSDVRERLPDLKPPPALEPEQARFRLFDSITTFMKSASRRQPLVLILDDLHWADKPSLLLLEFVSREVGDARLLLLGAYRDVELSRQHPLAEALGELTRARLFQRVLLRGLGQEDVGRFIEMTTGSAPPEGLVRAVYTHTEGNPLFVTEVVRLLVQEGGLSGEAAKSPQPPFSKGGRGGISTGPAGTGARTDESWTIRIPEGVREVIGRRLNRLSQRCNQTLTIASVIGREFSLEQLKPLIEDPSAGSGLGMSEDRLLEVLEEALAARVIEELPRSVGRYQFNHALIQETLSQELSTTRRVRLHGRIAEMLENLYGDQAETHAAELAHHFAEAQTVLGKDKLVRYALLAGERALTAYAWEEAQAHFERGLVAKGVPLAGTEPAEDAESARLLFGLGRAQPAQFSFLPVYVQEAVANLTRAFQYYVQAGELDRAVAIAEYPVRPQVGVPAGLDGLVRPALTMVPPNSQREGRLLATSGRVKGLDEGDYQAAESAFQKALAIALQSGDQALEMRILAEAAQVDFYHLRLPEALRKSLRAIELSSSLSDLRVDCAGGLAASWAAFSSGQLAVGQRHAEAMLAAAERLRDRFWLSLALWHCERACSLKGDWTAARRFSDRGLAVAPEAPTLLSSRATLEFEAGEAAQGEVYLRRLVDIMETQRPGPTIHYASVAHTIGVAGWITGVADRFDLAKRAAQTVVSSSFATPAYCAWARIGPALIAVIQGDGPGCEKLHLGLQPARGMLLSSITVDRVLGLLAQTMGQLDKAAEHFEDALAFCRKAGYRPELAWTCCDYAEALLVGAGLKPAPTAADRRKAMALLDEALKISSELGMRPLMERVLSRKVQLQGISSVDLKTSIDTVAAEVEREQPDLRAHAAPDGTVTILFSDIEGSTNMTQRLGDLRAQEVLRDHNAIVRQQVAAQGGFEVKSLGDGFMVAFSSARRALRCAIGIQRRLAAYNREHPAEPVRVRMGLHTGEVVKDGEDFFGRNVILASRIAGQARGGEILVSGLLKELTESGGDIRFGEGMEAELKGLSGRHRVYAVVWE